MGDEVEEEPPPVIDKKETGAASSKMSMSALRRRRLDLRRLKLESCSSTGKRAKSHDEDSSVNSSSSSTAAAWSSGDDEREAAVVSSYVTPPLSHGAASVIGRRREMEDAVTVAPGFAAAEAGEGGVVVPSAAYDFFGVYDGHGGRRVAEACRERLHVVLAEEVAGGKAEGRWREAMAASFARVDGELARAGKWSEGRTVGSTAVVAVVGPRRIVVANCGDSRAVLSRGGVVVPLSFDHKPERADEMERVEAAGGRVINWDGYRILGVLAISRSIGDYYLKPFVTSEPEVTVTERTLKDEFLILASDGLWDVVSNEVACHIIRQCLNGKMARMFPDAVDGRSAAAAAAILAELAMARGSKDNISVIVVQFRRLGTSNL